MFKNIVPTGQDNGGITGIGQSGLFSALVAKIPSEQFIDKLPPEQFIDKRQLMRSRQHNGTAAPNRRDGGKHPDLMLRQRKTSVRPLQRSTVVGAVTAHAHVVIDVL